MDERLSRRLDAAWKCQVSSQDNTLNNIFTIGANIATVATIIYGFTLDRFGVRVNAFSGAVMMCVGWVLLAVGDSEVDSVTPGFALVAHSEDLEHTSPLSSSHNCTNR